MSEWRIRTADPDRDAEALVEIYRPYVEKTAITFEYVTPSVEEFRARMRHTLEKYPYLVIEKAGGIENPDDVERVSGIEKNDIEGEGSIIGGYAYVSPFVGREAYQYSVETSIYLNPVLRHLGLGRKLYQALEDLLLEMHICNLNACIGVPKEGETLPFLDNNSCEFHAHLGYRTVGRFHSCGYKFGTWLDMVWMEKMLQDHPEHPPAILPYSEVRNTRMDVR
jgi:L-amino acid N-acyltransferase YncA